jgi:antitoxin component YwqK of YwqJK toxin-antitoxin module
MKWTLVIFLAFLISCEEKKSKNSGLVKGKDGVVKQFSKDGKLETEITLKDGKRHGIARNYYRNGKVSLEINYVDNGKDGQSKRFYESGKIYQLTNYKKDKIDGFLKKYRESGQVISEARYENDEPCNGLREYLLNGNLKKKYPIIQITPINRLREEGFYILALKLTERNNSVHYYKGKLSPSGCLHQDLDHIYFNEAKKQGEIKYYLPPGGFLMEEINIIAKVKTSLGNEYITQRSYNLAIDN